MILSSCPCIQPVQESPGSSWERAAVLEMRARLSHSTELFSPRCTAQQQSLQLQWQLPRPACSNAFILLSVAKAKDFLALSNPQNTEQQGLTPVSQCSISHPEMLWPGTVYGSRLDHLKTYRGPALETAWLALKAESPLLLITSRHNNSYQPPQREHIAQWQPGCSSGTTTYTSSKNRALDPISFATCSWFYGQPLDYRTCSLQGN